MSFYIILILKYSFDRVQWYTREHVISVPVTNVFKIERGLKSKFNYSEILNRKQRNPRKYINEKYGVWAQKNAVNVFWTGVK